MKTMIQFRELILMIIKRPSTYIGDNCLNSFRVWLDGYSYALACKGFSLEKDESLFFREYNDWVACRMHYYESTSGWSKMITDKVGNGEPAFRKFKELFLDLFSREEIVIARINNLNKFSLKLDDKGNESDRVYFPKKLRLVKYTSDPGYFIVSDEIDKAGICKFYPNKENLEIFSGISVDKWKVENKMLWDENPDDKTD